MARPRRPDPPPLRTNDVHVAVAGTVMWTTALIVLLIVDLPDDGRWWLWVCGVGIAIGLFGIWYIPKLQAARERQARPAEQRDRDVPAHQQKPT